MMTHQLDCISLDQAKNTYTPADLYASTAECIKSNRSKDAAKLFILASGYSCYDAKRITDRSAHGTKSVLIMNNIASLPDNDARKNWKSEAKKIMEDITPLFAVKLKKLAFLTMCQYIWQHMVYIWQHMVCNLIKHIIQI